MVHRVFIAIAALAWAASASAEPPLAQRAGPEQVSAASLPADETLSRLIAESLAARPELARGAAIVRARRERVPQVGALPDPMVQVGIQNDGFSSIELGRMETSYISLMASQTFPWPGKRGLRRGVAELDAVEAEQVLTRVRLSTEADVRRAYLDLLLARDRLALLAQLESIWAKSFGVARARYESGDGAQSDVLRAQLEQNRIRQRRLMLEAEETSRRAALNRLRARPLDEAIETPMTIRGLPALNDLTGFFSAELAALDSPELAALQVAARRAERSVAVAEKDYYPDLTLGAGVMMRGALPPMWQVTLGAPLPVYAGSKQSRAVAENRAWADAARHEAAALEQLLALRTAERRAVFESLRQSVDMYEHGLLVQSQATTESTLAQYEVGKVSFASVLEATAGLITDQEGFLESLASAHRISIAQAERSLEAPAMPSLAGGSASMSSGASATAPAAAPPTTSGMPMGAGAGAGPASSGGM
jgi:outer membrane protein, heavy metal efflux system